ncbi:hypothetical protein ACFRCW_40030, partial [Streptomyces sp. NPDC056653]|uniref:hypothetical protein n=1 Tax=Streptomyces sp. NPDC056653 TaxID=3345894 RepID=UPI0036951919
MANLVVLPIGRLVEVDDPVQPYRFTDADVRRSRPSRTSSRTTIRQSDECLTATANEKTVWGSKSHRCSSSRVSVLVDDPAEDAGAQEPAG